MNITLLIVIIIRFWAVETGEPIYAKVWPEPSLEQCKMDASVIIAQPDPPGTRTEVECDDSDLGARLFGAKTI